jgi:hypothetical protein
MEQASQLYETHIRGERVSLQIHLDELVLPADSDGTHEVRLVPLDGPMQELLLEPDEARQLALELQEACRLIEEKEALGIPDEEWDAPDEDED